MSQQNETKSGDASRNSLAIRFLRRPESLLLALGFFALFYGLGAQPLFDWDEGAFSEATREMIARGDYLSTYLNGEYRPVKPILIYWLQAASAHLFGLSSFAMRLPSAICAAAWAFALFLFLRRTASRDAAFAGVIFMLGALQILVVGRAAISDALLNLWIASAMFCAYLYLQSLSRHWAILAFAAIGLGVLTKGPIAGIIPGVVTLLFCAIRRRWSDYLRLWLNPAGIAAFAVITLPWFLLQYHLQGQAFIDSFFMKHNVGRFTDAMEGHGGGPHYYFLVVLIGLLPFTGFLWQPLRNWRAILDNELQLFAALWFLFVLVFFTIAATKLPHYIIYGYTGLWILMALQWRQAQGRGLWIPPLLLSVALLFLPEILGYAAGQAPDAYGRAVMLAAAEAMGIGYRLLVGAIALVFLILTIWKGTLDGRWRLGAAAVAMIVLVNFALLPPAGEALQRPIVEAAALARERNYNVVFWKFYWPSFLFYHGRTAEMRIPMVGEVALMKDFELQYLKEYEVLYQRYGVALVRVTAMDDERNLRMFLQ